MVAAEKFAGDGSSEDESMAELTNRRRDEGRQGSATEREEQAMYPDHINSDRDREAARIGRHDDTRSPRLPGLEHSRHAEADDARLAAELVIDGLVEDEREPGVLADDGGTDGCAGQSRQGDDRRTTESLGEERADGRLGLDDVRRQAAASAPPLAFRCDAQVGDRRLAELLDGVCALARLVVRDRALAARSVDDRVEARRTGQRHGPRSRSWCLGGRRSRGSQSAA